MHRRLAVQGFLIWVTGTLALRVGGQYVLAPGRPVFTALLLAVSVPASAALVRWLCRRVSMPRESWLTGAVLLLLPTLLLDPFAGAFFPLFFPNMAPEMAGAFGGWMLCCCAGGLLGTIPGSGVGK